MTGRGLDLSRVCLCGRSRVTVGEKKKKKSLLRIVIHTLPAFSDSTFSFLHLPILRNSHVLLFYSTNLNQDLSINTFLKLFIEPSILYGVVFLNDDDQ